MKENELMQLFPPFAPLIGLVLLLGRSLARRFRDGLNLPKMQPVTVRHQENACQHQSFKGNAND